MKILSFETVPTKSDLLVPYLRSRLAIVDETGDFEDLLELVKFYDYDAVLLRLSEDRMNDVDLIRRLRQARVRSQVVVLARKLNEAARLRVLQTGADDLIVEALSHEEVFMKIQNLVRRSRGFQDNVLTIGNIEINMNARRSMRKASLLHSRRKNIRSPRFWRFVRGLF